MGWVNKVEPPKPDPHPKCDLPRADGSFVSKSTYKCDVCNKIWTFYYNEDSARAKPYWETYTTDGWSTGVQYCS